MTKATKKIVAMYLLSVIFYGIFVTFISSTVHIECDEELYLELAKSFHYSGVFRFNGEPATYNSILYSVLLSVVYYFYSPEKILFFMRLFGTIIMCSAVFPIWGLARRVLNNTNYAIAFSGISLFFPYMFECGYIMQEILSYPLFMWTVYFLYRLYETDWESTKWLILSSFFSMLCFFCKVHLFFIPVVVNLIFFVELYKKEKKWKNIGRIAIYDTIYCILSIVIYIFILSINGFEQGSNRYGDHLAALFPITGKTILCGIMLSLTCVSLFILCTGIVPIVSVLFNYDIYKKHNKNLYRFTLYSCLLLVFVTVFLSTIPEEGLTFFQHRFMFRYFQMLVPLVFLLAMKVWEEKRDLLCKRALILILPVLMVCLCYFIVMQGKTTQGIVDGFVFLLLKNVSRYIAYGDVICIVMTGSGILILTWIQVHGKNIRNFILCGFLLSIIGLWILNCIQLPYYNNVVAGGDVIERDSIVIANYLNDESIDFVYYVVPSDGERYPRNFYGYLKQEWKPIDRLQIDEIVAEEGRAVFLAIKEENMEMDSILHIDLSTEKLELYIEESDIE